MRRFGIFVYDVIVTAAGIVLWPLFRLHKRGQRRLAERYGNWGEVAGECLWFHGASVGEMNGLLPIIARVREKKPGLKILVTATSVTGLERAEKLADFSRLMPFDARIWLLRATKKIKPAAFIFAETEIWPGVLSLLQQRGVPCVMVNARLGSGSLRAYRRLAWIIRPVFSGIAAILCSSRADLKRFQEFGVDEEKVFLTGNAKYDRPAVSVSRQEVRARLRIDDQPLLVLGSLRPGEEKFWFPAIAALWENGAKLNVVVAPRHLECLGGFEAELQKLNIKHERSSGRGQGAACRCVVLDTMGELEALYSAAELAFIGGSLVDWGGHNPLEAARYGTPVIMGPYVSSVSEVVGALEEAGGILRISQGEQVAEALRKFMSNPSVFQEMGRRGQETSQKFIGAVDRVMEKLEAYL